MFQFCVSMRLCFNSVSVCISNRIYMRVPVSSKIFLLREDRLQFMSERFRSKVAYTTLHEPTRARCIMGFLRQQSLRTSAPCAKNQVLVSSRFPHALDHQDGRGFNLFKKSRSPAEMCPSLPGHRLSWW